MPFAHLGNLRLKLLARIPASTRGEESANIMSSRARGGSQLFDCNLSSQNLFLKKLALGNGLALKISPLFRGSALA
jgi:hypothetical protein